MSDDEMIKCLIAFILGWIMSRMMGNGFSVGAQKCVEKKCLDNEVKEDGAGPNIGKTCCGYKFPASLWAGVDCNRFDNNNSIYPKEWC